MESFSTNYPIDNMKKLSVISLVLALFVLIGVIVRPTVGTAPSIVTDTKKTVMPGGESGIVSVNRFSKIEIHPYHELPTTEQQTDWREYNPETVTVVIEGVSVEFNRTSHTVIDEKHTTWTGRRTGNQFSFMTAASSKDNYASVIEMGDGSASYMIVANNVEGTVTTVMNDRPVNCLNSNLGSEQFNGPAVHGDVVQSDTNATVVDLLLLVDVATFRSEKSNEDLLYTKSLANVEASNQELLNSKITNVRWNMVGLSVIPESVYVYRDVMTDDLPKLTDKNSPLGKFAHDLADQLGADQLHLLVTGGGPYGGLGYMNWRYSMARYDQISFRTMSHELGHNFGCNHDRRTAKAIGTDQTNYNYGYQQEDTAYYYYMTMPDVMTSGDIMSYAPHRLPYFSNPDVVYEFTNTDAATKQTHYIKFNVGVPVGQPDAANCSLTISENVGRMSSYSSRLTDTPFIVMQPVSMTIDAATPITLTTKISTTGGTYQWYKNGTVIEGATSSNYTVKYGTSVDTYYCVVSINGRTLTSATSTITSAIQTTFNPNAKLVNISTRSQVREDLDQGQQIAGFVISGTTPKTVLIRAGGPSLAPFSITNYLANPFLTLYDSNQKVVSTNDDWDRGQILMAANSVGAYSFAAGSKDAAILVELNPGLYTAIVTSADKKPGVALVEVYEVNKDGSSRAVNISTRSYAAPGENNQVAGFIVEGSGYKTLLIRAGGPALSKWIKGVIADPVLTVYDKNGNILTTNDNWSHSDIDAAAKKVSAYDWTSGSTDAAVLITVPQGAYTAVVTPKDGTASGIALVEVYEVY